MDFPEVRAFSPLESPCGLLSNKSNNVDVDHSTIKDGQEDFLPRHPPREDALNAKKVTLSLIPCVELYQGSLTRISEIILWQTRRSLH